MIILEEDAIDQNNVVPVGTPVVSIVKIIPSGSPSPKIDALGVMLYVAPGGTGSVDKSTISTVGLIASIGPVIDVDRSSI